MRRTARKTPAIDLSIRYDELENDRRLLEHRLKSNASIPAPPPASDDDEEDFYHYHQNSSVEVPRHLQEPMPYPDFASFAHRSRENIVEEDSHMQMGWSYRTGDDDEGFNPYGGGDQSTVGHHISAVTMTAGLGGGRGARRDVSMSGAEYDPDRPLNQIMAGVGRLSMFDNSDQSKSKNNNNNITFEPLVVDSTAELDRILQSGYAPQNQSIHPTPPMSRASTSSLSDSEPASPSRPKLSDHLRTLAFSPKRPRTAQGMRPPSPVHHHLQASPLAKRSQGNASVLSTNSTPRPTRRVPQPPTPDVRLQAPTPSTAPSRFTKMARGIVREIADTQQAETAAKAKRPPPSAAAPTPVKSSLRKTAAAREQQHHSKNRIHLPDVTGLTAAVESPARLGTEYRAYKGAATREAEARFLQTLGQVQTKLEQLNEENGISRRRVRELEMELDECKREVVRERSRLLEKEEVIVKQQKEIEGRAKGKARAVDEEDEEVMMKRYKNAVEEKKALEALINSLRSHLTRLTQELASHSELLKELKELRETDSRALREKSNEITRLNDEVERLAGEIEVLRGVVEEGLRERRANREPSMHQDEADTSMDMSMDHDEEEEEEEEAQETEEAIQPHQPRPQNPLCFDTADESDQEEDETEDSTYEPSTSTFSISKADLTSTPAADRTVRTDHATLGTTTTATPHRVQFIDERELRRIEREVEERRADVSMNASMRSRSRSPPLEVTSFYERPRMPTPLSPSPNPRARTGGLLGGGRAAQQQQQQRQSERLQERRRASPPPVAVTGETPFPQIRGERLEKLFFAAPEHNPRTCAVCFRGKGHGHGHNTPQEARESKEERTRKRRGSGGEGPGMVTDREIKDVPSDASYFRRVGSRAGLPPQTVAMRVIRELEDDFTHYKSVYVELADQYKDMDPVSDVQRRNMLAKHLKEVVDILEQKGDQIASLSDLLAFKEKEGGKKFGS